MNLDGILSDPRLVTKTIGGREYKFWLHRAAMRIALDEYGFDLLNFRVEEGSNDIQTVFDLAMRHLWIGQLLFNRVSFDEFDLQFLSSDGQDLADAYSEMMKKQVHSGKVEETKGKPKPKK